MTPEKHSSPARPSIKISWEISLSGSVATFEQTPPPAHTRNLLESSPSTNPSPLSVDNSYIGTDDSTLSLPEVPPPRSRKIHGWKAYTGLTFHRTAPPAQQPESATPDSDTEISPPRPSRRPAYGICPLCRSTRLRKGWQFCRLCTMAQGLQKPAPGDVAVSEEPEAKRPRYEIEMLKGDFEDIPPLAARENAEEDYELIDVVGSEEDARDRCGQ